MKKIISTLRRAFSSLWDLLKSKEGRIRFFNLILFVVILVLGLYVLNRRYFPLDSFFPFIWKMGGRISSVYSLIFSVVAVFLFIDNVLQGNQKNKLTQISLQENAGKLLILVTTKGSTFIGQCIICILLFLITGLLVLKTVHPTFEATSGRFVVLNNPDFERWFWIKDSYTPGDHKMIWIQDRSKQNDAISILSYTFPDESLSCMAVDSIRKKNLFDGQ